MRTLFFALVPLLLFFTCTNMQADIYGILTGKVTDSANNPLIGATVLVEGTSRGAVTKADGSYTVLKIPAGTFTVRVKSIGFRDYTAQVRISSDATVELNARLAHDTKETVSIVKTAQELYDPGKVGSIRKIDQSQLTSIPVESVQSVVAKQSGVISTNGVNIRSCRGTQYRIDGLDVNDPFVGGTGQTPSNYYPTQSSANVETEVLSGGPIVDYGNALGGIADAVSQPAKQLQYFTPIFTQTETDKYSTFGMDVDNASYTLARSSILNGNAPNPASIRPEEFLNYFDYGYAAPCEDEFAVYMECAPSMFAGDSVHLLKIGIKGRELYNDERSDAVLTFVIDVSGSMSDDLPSIKNTLTALVKKLRPTDIVCIVTFGNTAAVHLQPTRAEEKSAIARSIESLAITGSTNVGAGIKLGYDMAAAAFDSNKINRVIFLGDGMANNGLTSGDAILQTVAESASKGIALTVIGMGMGGYHDALMEHLADKGNGKYFYIDSGRELNAIINNNFTGLIDDIARDAKIQVEFDPLIVESYRLIGYENRDIADSLFRDDTQDAGEIGAGYTVTALYKVKLRPQAEGILARVALRYFVGRTTAVREVQQDYTTAQIEQSYSEAGYSLKLAAVVAEFAEYLRTEPSTKSHLLAQLNAHTKEVEELSGGRPEVKELSKLITYAIFLGGTGGLPR